MKGISTVVATILMLVITIALAGTVMVFMRTTVQTQTQGIEVLDTSCVGNNVSFMIRNFGTHNITNITCTQLSPAADTTCNIMGFTTPLEPGHTRIITENCTGTGGRTCVYRLIPTVGQVVDATAYCT